MFRKLTVWCLSSTPWIVLSAWGAEPRPVKPEAELPPVVSAREAAEWVAPPAVKGVSPPADYGWTDDCEACEPHYVFPLVKRAPCDQPTTMFGPTSRWNMITKPRLQESHWGYCDQFCRRPFGQAVAGHFHHQIVNGLAQQMMLFEYDFLETAGRPSEQLNDRGLYQLEKIAQRYQQGLGPIVIATSGTRGLDQARKQWVEGELKKLGVSFAPEHVLVRPAPRATLNASDLQNSQRLRDRLMSGGGALSGGIDAGSTTGTIGSGAAGSSANAR